MDEQSAFINEEIDAKKMNDDEDAKWKELRKIRNERRRKYYHRKKLLEENGIRKNKEKVQKSNAQRQRKCRRRKAGVPDVDMKNEKLDSDANVSDDNNIEELPLQENLFDSHQVPIREQRTESFTPEVIIRINTGILSDEASQKKRSLDELDRFKRRLIRAVARLMIDEKKPEEEIWSQLKIETGSNCKLLWTRMKALTEKKVGHLLDVNDHTVAIPKPARMSLTDWLLFDLVLVHQKIDLIGQDKPHRREDPEALVKLFELVKKFKIEGKAGDHLAEAWSNATIYYNNKGHQCSPMLLQRRWYQLKELTRTKFYNFWYAYRGTVKRLALAEPHTPTPLQAAIAQQYKHLVTRPFLEWEELIERRLVTLPEEFERQMLQKSAPRCYVRKLLEDGPDLELIEPRIETIDLRNIADEESEDDEKDQAQDISTPTVKIKEEPLDSEMDIGEIQVEAPKKSIYDSVLESTDKENEKLESMDANDFVDDDFAADDDLFNEEKEIEETIATTLDQEDSVLPQITNVFGNVSDANVFSNMETVEQSDVKNVNIDENATVAHTSVSGILQTSSKDNIIVKTQDSDSVGLDDKDKVGNTNNSKEEIETKVPDGIEDSDKLVSSTEDIPKDNLDPKTDDNAEDVVIIDNTPAPVVISDSDDEEKFEKSDEIVDDIFLPAPSEPMDIEKYTSTDPETKGDIDVSKVALTSQDNEDKKSDIPGFSFGQLPNDISFADEGIVYVEEDEKRASTDAEDVPKIDPKLLMFPIVYTTRLDHMALAQFQHISDKTLIETIATKSKPIKLEPQTSNPDQEIVAETSRPVKQEPQPLDENATVAKSEPVEKKPDTDVPPDDSDSDDDKIPDSKKVKPSSHLLQKPRSRTYNPIQLCKNPDFNTRLKWLTVGFFTIPRNRGLIKTCKPLTIDVSKAFESKLIEGRLYLKPSDVNIKTEDPVKVEEESIQSVTVLPSAMPVQSLINNSKIPDIPAPSPSYFYKPTPEVASCSSTNERNKVINLPDISEIRRINQRLLTAEVTPIQVQNNQPQVPVSIVTSPDTQRSITKVTVPIPGTNTQLLNEANYVRGPPKCVDITQDMPNKTIKHSATGSDLLMAKGPSRANAKNKYPVRPATAAWKPRTLKEKIPWLDIKTGHSNYSKMVGETLLTLDTLNKMLFLLIEKEEEPPASNEKKNKNNKKSDKSQQNYQSKSRNDVTDDNNSSKNLSETANKSYPNKVKFKVRSAEPRAHPRSTVDKKPEPNKKQVQFCCWSRQRMLDLLFSKRQRPPHDCPTNQCRCCCQHMLKDYMKRAMQMKESSEANVDVMTYLSSTVRKLNDNDESSVTVPVKVVVHFPPTHHTPCIAVEELTISNETSESVPATEIDTSEVSTTGVPQDAAMVTTTEATAETSTIVDSETSTIVSSVTRTQESSETSTLASPVTSREVTLVPTLEVRPVPTLEVTPITVDVPSVSLVAPPNLTVRGIETPVMVSSGDGISNPSRLSRRTSADNQIKRKILIPLDPNPSIKVLPAPTDSPPKNDLKPRRYVIQKTLRKKTAAPIMKSNITSKPSTLPHALQKKEKMIFINSKHLIDKPTECPVLLGKNKILLTTVKFPHNLKQFEETKLALGPSLKIPKGVQLTCLSDGTISYSIDKNVPVKVQELAEMPAIIAAVRAHMDLHSQPVPANNQPSVAEAEVVDLIDDDDDNDIAKSTTEHNKNNESSPVTEERNEINTNNQNVVTGEISLIDMQEGEVKQLSDIKESLPSAEVQDQPNTSGLEYNQLESTTQNISTEVQQPLLEQVNEQPEPLTQKEAIEVSNQVEPATQPEPANQPEPTNQPESANQPEPANHREPANKPDEPANHPEPANKPDEPANQLEPANKPDASANQPEPANKPDEPANQPEPANQSEPANQDNASLPCINKSKNILSDLMEMSGIFDEDMSTTAPPVEPVQEQPVLPQISVETSTSEPPKIVVQPDLDKGTTSVPVIKTAVGELSPISSLYELKYACLNKGTFFKLDFSTGYLVPINVCMKQNVRQVPLVLPRIAPKGVIDLTDEVDTLPVSSEAPNQHTEDVQILPSDVGSAEDVQMLPNSSSRSLLIAREPPKANKGPEVKPVKLYKSPNILRILGKAKMKRKLAQEEEQKNKRNEPKLYHKLKQKQAYKIPEDTTKETSPVLETATVLSDDSSDEEPLSNIVKRRKANEAELEKAKSNEPEQSNETESEFIDYLDEVTEDFEMSDLTSKETLIEVDMDESNDEEEGCILGV
ncbi:uncharacterized protein LOC110383133 isoform X1 [Helicoverpa armigera]|uniref:uncharacterized protein LOC110383133 isoform X1 n=2 Tax=Helicoverpa armigera TaxID=29058 RepID=UPI0030832B91